MIVPKPPVTLEGHCSVIHENTLYTYSSEGFASIPLERNGTWSELTPGELVSDAVCITGGIEGDEQQQALYIVGGSSSKSNPPGLQRYSFKDETWKSLPLTVDVLANRTSHNAVYLTSNSTIFVFGGDTKDASTVSSDTFYIDTTTAAPFTPQSGSAENSSPAASPALLTWNDEKAIMFGGQRTPEGIHFWDLDQGWHDAGMAMGKELPSGAKVALLDLDDGDKMMQTFDMSVTPNTVSATQIVPNTPQSSNKRKRVEPPTYDGTLAPNTTRRDCSLAQGDGVVVISSGSGTDTLSIFNQTSNSWVNSTKLFYGDKSEQEILGSTTTTTTTSLLPTATQTDSTTPDSSSDDSGSNNIGVILGATLGSLLGVAAILVLILLFIKRKKQKMRAGGVDKDRLSFQDQGVEPLARSAYPMAESPAPRAASVDSLAIFSGNMSDEKSPRPAGAPTQYTQQTSHPTRPSPLNNIQSSGESVYSIDDKAIEAGDSSVRPGDRTTEEGWGKYFQDNDAPTLVSFKPQFDSVRDSNATLWPEVGGNNTRPSLNMTFLEEPKPLGKVNSGSPTTEFGRQISIPESQSARISSASADSASIHSEDEDPTRYHGVQTQSWLGRPPSSTYSRSFYNPHQSTRELPSTAAPTATPTTTNYRKHDSARTNTRGSSILIPDGQPFPRNNLNSDMSWLNINAGR